MAKTITVSEQSFSLLWSFWVHGDVTEDDILRRILLRLAAEPRDSTFFTKGDQNEVQNYVDSDQTQISPETGGRRFFSDVQKSSADPPRKVRWVDDVRLALVELGGEANLSEIYRTVRAARMQEGRRVGPNFQSAVRQTIQAHSSDSNNFEKREDCFTRVKDGRWKLRES